jgi:ATP-dependent Clp protease adaptor protein ClpS
MTDKRLTPGTAKEVGTATRTKPKPKKPSMYRVLLLNDDYTPMEFVIDVLETVFQKSPAEAYRIMMQVHLGGRGVAGIYPWEVAETKADTVITRARASGHPLQASIEDA